MLDVVIRNGLVVDGSGAPGVLADVAIRAGRIVGVGNVIDEAIETVDATGRVVAPGFIDLHTHYDAQLFWDPGLSPSPLHGVTTVIAGNCGLTLGPVAPGDEEFLVRMLSRVEAIPIETLTEGVKFTWRTFADFLDAAERITPVVNIGFLVGHSSIRRQVMGDAASTSAATDEQIAEMARLLADGLNAGGLGFSSSTSTTQRDGDGRPTPPNFATDDELVTLAAVCRQFPGTSLEFIPASAAYGFDPDGNDVTLLARMSKAAQRHVNWNTVLLRYPGKPDIQDLQLDACDRARELGGVVVPMIIPHNFRVRTDFQDSDVGFRSLPGFEGLFAMTYAERLVALADAGSRKQLIDSIEHAEQGANAMFRASMHKHVVSDIGPAYLQHLVGRPVTEIASERGTELLATIFDLAVESGLDVGFERKLVPVDTEAERALRKRVLRDERLILGASDGGAHVRGVVNVEYSTASFDELVRQEGVFTVEELVAEFTSVPARLYGLVDRGLIREGAIADLVVFDPDTIATSPVELRRDLPGGAPRLYSTGIGIDVVYVAGQAIVRDGDYTGVAPGRVLRSGRDTQTTPMDSLLVRARTA